MNDRHDTLHPVLTRTEHQATQNTQIAPDTWWGNFVSTQTHLSEQAKAVLYTDAIWIADKISSPISLDADLASWRKSRVKTGIVVGSVQSGKTANMLAVTALLLDRGVNCVIILSGTQIGLWLQTYDRFLSNLDCSNPANAYKKNSKRVLIPSPDDVINDEGRLEPHQYVISLRHDIKKAIENNNPIISVIPKIGAHIKALKDELRKSIKAHFQAHGAEEFKIVILDDEADDASILDAKTRDKTTPWNIESIWSSITEEGATFADNVYCCYVAYTATPQANFLQETHNPLSPKDFAASLRVPGLSGTVENRELTYIEYNGLSSYYIGGDFFYGNRGNASLSLCVSYQISGNFSELRSKMLGDALRAYMVAGAIRLLAENKTLSQLPWNEGTTKQSLYEILPSPHTMLFHPSSDINSHFQGALEIARWSKGESPSPEEMRQVDYIEEIDPVGLSRRLENEEHLWRSWLDEYASTAHALRDYPKSSFPIFDQSDLWRDVKNILHEEIFPFVKVRVLNSDPKASDRPQFGLKPTANSPNAFSPPADLLSIFVAGNVLSRGLTLEGLTTSLFLRSSSEPAADTQMQMQRWFGYRGKHLPFCRLFSYEDQIELFKSYNDTDEVIKTCILKSMATPEGAGFPNILVLQGEGFWATKKVSTSRLPLHPGAAPSIKIVEQAHQPYIEHNLSILNDQLSSGTWKPLYAPQTLQRGIIRTEPVDSLHIANILESFKYSHHQPSNEDIAYQRWDAISGQLGLSESLLRLQKCGAGKVISAEPDSCPYSIAAYLRLWTIVANQPYTPGFYPTHMPKHSWSMVPQSVHLGNLPYFYIAVRFGQEGPCNFPFHAEIRAMKRGLRKQGILETLWGTRGHEETYLGDEYLDYHYHGTQPFPTLHSGSRWRQASHPGLLLFHVIKDDLGQELITVGLSIPHGGPDHIAATRGGKG